MKNFVQPGEDLTLIAPAGGVTSGLGVKIGQLFVVAKSTAAATEEFVGSATGVFDLAKVSAQAWAVGDLLYWDDTAKLVTAVVADNFKIGAATAIALNPTSTGNVKLNDSAHKDADGGETVFKKSLAVGFADLTDADGSQSFNLGTALPANAIVIGHAVSISNIFDDGVAGTFSVDIGLAGALDAICNGADLTTAIGELHGPLGARSGGRYQAVQLLATVLGSVNVDTATQGAAVFEVYYIILA